MKKINVEELKKAIKDKNITRWSFHKCSMCGYPCGYCFHEDVVEYDNGCDCGCGYNISESSWEDVVDQFNRQIDWAESKENKYPELTIETIKKDAEYLGIILEVLVEEGWKHDE